MKPLPIHGWDSTSFNTLISKVRKHSHCSCMRDGYKSGLGASQMNQGSTSDASTDEGVVGVTTDSNDCSPYGLHIKKAEYIQNRNEDGSKQRMLKYNALAQGCSGP
jgi:hypothetical protein